MRAPWSPHWYLVGKQIRGRRASERRWTASGASPRAMGAGWNANTVAVEFRHDAGQAGGVLEKASKRRGSRGLLLERQEGRAPIWEDAGFCDQEVLSIEVVKGKRRHVVDIRFGVRR